MDGSQYTQGDSGLARDERACGRRWQRLTHVTIELTKQFNQENNMPMYPEILVVPMREELTRLGVEELRTTEEVDSALKNQPGTAMVIVNSICGCAAGRMRPAVRMALENSSHPDKSYSVFAGQDKEATDRARGYFTGYPPSSPSIAILRDGQLVYMMQRREIESREAGAIAADLKAALNKFCGKPAAV
jgi:putative YphP/YqiW family bacilliredoxin